MLKYPLTIKFLKINDISDSIPTPIVIGAIGIKLILKVIFSFILAFNHFSILPFMYGVKIPLNPQ